MYHSDLDIYYSNLEIISKRFDAVAQKTMEIQIGSFKGAITRRAYMADTVSSGDTAADKAINAVQQEQYDSNTRIMSSDIASMQLFAIEEISKRNISELEG